MSNTDNSQKNENIYVVSGSDGLWTAVAGSECPAGGVFLTEERNYPAYLYYYRMDTNGSSTMERETPSDRTSLIESLNWIGKCGHTLAFLWDFDRELPMSNELASIFQAAYERKCEILQAAADEMYAEFAEENLSEENVPTAVDDILHSDKSFRYQMLGRLRSDCEYYLGYGNRATKHLWAGSEKEQIACMRALYNSFGPDEKPNFLTPEKINEYEQKMVLIKKPLSSQISSASSKAAVFHSQSDNKDKSTDLDRYF